MELDKLKAVLEMLTAFGVAEYKTPELELKLHKINPPQLVEMANLLPTKQEISDEEMLYASSPYYDVLKAQHAAEAIAPLQESK